MTLLRSQESRIRPGRRQKWAAGARRIKDIVERQGVNLRIFQVTLGGVPDTVVTGSLIDDWEALAARSAALNADPDYRAFMQEQATDPDAPYAERISLTLLEDISEEVGGATPQPDNATVYNASRMRILPGKRPQAIALLGQIREALSGDGREVPSIWQVAVGEAGGLLTVRGFTDLAALAKARSQPPLASVQEIIQRAQSDAAFPYFEQIDSRILTDISDQL